MFLLERVPAGVKGGITSRIAGKGTLGHEGVAKTSLPFGWNFPLRKIKKAAVDDINIEVKR